MNRNTLRTLSGTISLLSLLPMLANAQGDKKPAAHKAPALHSAKGAKMGKARASAKKAASHAMSGKKK